jgi:hypothetical protein
VTDIPAAVSAVPYIPRGRPVRNAVIALMVAALVVGVVGWSGVITPHVTAHEVAIDPPSPSGTGTLMVSITNRGWLAVDVDQLALAPSSDVPIFALGRFRGSVHIAGRKSRTVRLPISCLSQGRSGPYDFGPRLRVRVKSVSGVKRIVNGDRLSVGTGSKCVLP